MDWGLQQQDALKKVSDWITGGTATKQVYKLFGYAGSGKTTLAKHLVSGVDGNVYFAAYTGKAALVLRKKGCTGASTIHSLIYNPAGNATQGYADVKEQIAKLRAELARDGLTLPLINMHPRIVDLSKILNNEEAKARQPRFSRKDESPLNNAKLLVLDEASMVDGFIGRDLESFGCPILVLGDPAQLPPVKGTGYFTDCTPDSMLTEVHRQAEGNPIIHLATLARQHKPIPLGTYGESRVVRRGVIQPDEAVAAEQILVGRNATRHTINARVRQLRNYTSPYPQPGDKLVCRKNNKQNGLLNGSMWECAEFLSGGQETMSLKLASLDEARTVDNLECDTALFQGGEGLPWFEQNIARMESGNAITVHCSQGSQYSSGILFDESGAFRQDKWRHLYTGLTRFAEQVTCVLDYA